LFFSGRPFAVRRLVIAVVVNALDCQAGWTRPHIRNEIRVLEPPLAHLDAAAAVVFPLTDIRIDATLQHRDPTIVFRRSSAVPAFPVLEVKSCAAARLGFPALQMVEPSKNMPAAVAPALPVRHSLVLSFGALHGRQSTKAQSCDILEFGHRYNQASTIDLE
jgi:hypothetical protein